jgi:transcriptional regulator with XRE-family HTH domain
LEIRVVKAIIGTRIRKIRESKDYTQQNVADEIPMSFGAYSKIERGETNASLGRLTRIAEILEVDITDFFIDIKKKTTKLNEPKGEYGFATKGDIEELLKMIQGVIKEVNQLKAELKTVTENVPKKKGTKK